MESITRMRQICQTTREGPVYKMNWFDRNFLRKVSIYITKLCLKLGLSANQVTLIDFLFVIGAGVFFVQPEPYNWLIGLGLFISYLIVDCSDGEVARYNESKGRRKPQPLGFGALLGGIVDWFTWPYLLACMSFGIYFATGSILAFIPGFMAGIMRTIYLDVGLMNYSYLHEKGLLAKAIENKTQDNLGEAKLLGLGRVTFGIQGFIPMVLLIIILDWIVIITHGTPMIFGSQYNYPLVFNARFIYLIIFGLAATLGVFLKIIDAWKNGVRLQRI